MVSIHALLLHTSFIPTNMLWWILFCHCKYSLSYAAIDDTQRMMQMGGFGFDASKVSIIKTFQTFLNHLSYIVRSDLGPNLINCTLPFANWWPQSLSAEKDGLDIIQHEWALPRFEHRAESVLRKLVQQKHPLALYLLVLYWQLDCVFNVLHCCNKHPYIQHMFFSDTIWFKSKTLLQITLVQS